MSGNPDSIPHKTARFTVATTAAMVLAVAWSWPLSFITPLMVALFLGSPMPRPTLKQGAGLVFTIAVACAVGMTVFVRFVSVPIVFVPALSLALLRIFYAQTSGAPMVAVLFGLVALTALPLVALTSPGLASTVAWYLVIGTAGAMVIVWAAYGIMPEPTSTAATPAKTQAPRLHPSAVLLAALLWCSFQHSSCTCSRPPTIYLRWCSSQFLRSRPTQKAVVTWARGSL